MKLAVFDLDGTLLDTLPDLTDSVNYAMGKLGLPCYTNKQVAAMVGSGMAVTLTRALGKENLDKLHEARLLQGEYYSAHCNDKTKPFDGVLQLLARLHKDGVSVAVYSNKDQAFAESTCAKQFGNLVDYVVGTKPDGAIKPDVTELKKLVSKIGADNCVYCGDSDVDVMTARNANMPCVSVTWGYRNKQQLIDAGATVFADDCSQVYEQMSNLFENKR